jgi:hypothetical protein
MTANRLVHQAIIATHLLFSQRILAPWKDCSMTRILAAVVAVSLLAAGAASAHPYYHHHHHHHHHHQH